MCRNIKTLFNFEPPATEQEIESASLQFVRKISGTTRPSVANQLVFDDAVDEVARVVNKLLTQMTTQAVSKNREIEAAKALQRNARRFA
jgi:hypothetical protein